MFSSSLTRCTASAILIGDCRSFLYQKRDNIPQILYPGLLGLFGGHKEGSETPLQAVQREIEEETGFSCAPDKINALLTCNLPLPDGTRLSETIFVITHVPLHQLVITEGKPLPLSRQEVYNYIAQMTPATICATQVLLNDHSRLTNY